MKYFYTAGLLLLSTLAGLTPHRRRLTEVTWVTGVTGPHGGQGLHGNVNSVRTRGQVLEHEVMMMMMKRRRGIPYRGHRESLCVNEEEGGRVCALSSAS